MTVRSALLLIALLGLAACPVFAQTPQTPPGSPDWASYLGTPAFAHLVDGKSIVVLTRDGREYEGFFTISENALVLTRTTTVTAVPFDQVARVQKSTFRIRLHSLIGMGVGAAIGAVIGANICDGTTCPPEVFSFMTIFGVWGRGSGSGSGPA
jgi:hypothetical protein